MARFGFKLKGFGPSDSGSSVAITLTSVTISAVVPVDNGQKMVALYAVESPQNWFEDFGSGQLVNGVAAVTLDPTYAQTVKTELEYHVFLTPNGDCNGLYIGNKSLTSFEVRELKDGHSNIMFDYRIVAMRKGYEQVRMEDKTAMMESGRGQRCPLPSAGCPSAARDQVNMGSCCHAVIGDKSLYHK